MKKKLIFRISLILLVLIILILVLLPGFARRYSINHSKEILGRKFQMEKLKVNYFTGKITIVDFSLLEEDEQHIFISFDTLIVNIEVFQLFVDEFVVERFYLQGLKANIIQYDSAFNFDDLVQFHSDNSNIPESDTLNSDPFHFQCSNIELSDAEIIFEDKNVDKIIPLRDLSFFIPYIGWNQEEKSDAGLQFNFKNGGFFQSSILVDPIDGDYQAEITIQSLDIKTFHEYVENFAKINAVEGMFNSQINITGNIYQAEKSLISGFAEVNEFKVDDQNDKKFLSAQKVECVLKEVDIYNMSFVVDSLLLIAPYVYFELDTNTNNLSEIFYNSNPKDSSALLNSEKEPDSSRYSFYYAINHVKINKGIADYTDKLTGSPFDYYLSEIEMKADSIFSTFPWIDVYSQMLLNKKGVLKAEVGFNPLNPKDMILDYVITDFQLSDLNIYSRHYMGFPILYGDMYYKSHTEIMDNQLRSENKLIIHNAELGNKSGGLYKLPIKFALFLLKDRQGIINLDIPVRGDLNDPRVSIGKIVWNTFKNLIVKVVAAPFDFLAGFIDVDPKDIKTIEYTYMDTILTSEKQRQLNLLLELEQKKENLKIELVYFNDREIEKQQIAVHESGKLFAFETGNDFVKDELGFQNFLKAKTGLDTIDIVAASIQLIPESILDSLLNQLENARKTSIENYLFANCDSTGINVYIPQKETPKDIGAEPVFEIKYTMIQESDSSNN